MLRKLWLLIMTVVFLMLMGSTSMASGITDEPVYDEVERTVTDLNVIRRKSNSTSLDISHILRNMAWTHAKYMSYNDRLTSVEESDLEYYRGRYPWDRAVYYNYDQAYVYEFVRKDIGNYQTGIDGMLADPVTRSVMLDPMYTDIGMANVEGYMTFDFGGDEMNNTKYVYYPYPGQENVPVSWSGGSLNTVMGKTAGTEAVYGYPITVTYYGKDIETYSDISVSLRNVYRDEYVDFELIHPGEHYLLKNTFTVVPKESYSYNTLYELDVFVRIKDKRGVVKDFDEDVYGGKYRFKTEGFGEATSEGSYITRAEFTERLVKSEGYTLVEPLDKRFSDVEISGKVSSYIYTANNESLIQGFPDGSFGPDLNISRDQAYTIIVKAYEKKENHDPIIITDDNILDKYTDGDEVKTWAQIYLKKAAELGIILDKDGAIRPNGYMTEEEFDEILTLYKNNTN